MPIFDEYVWLRYMHIWATNDINGINHVARSSVHIFDIKHLTNVTSTLHI